MHEVAAIAIEPGRAVVYEHGWQSWSPTAAYRVDDRPARSTGADRHLMNYRPGVHPPADAFWGEGLLAVDPGDGGPVHVVATASPEHPVASVRADVVDGTVLVRADGPVRHHIDPRRDGVPGALGRWADRFAAEAGVAVRQAPTLWCSWYHYGPAVTEADVDENLAALDDLGVDADVVQIDDGHQSELGDWLTGSDRFTSLPDTVARIRDRGRRAGIWVAPFLVGARSELARRRPELLMPGCHAGHGWGQDLHALDATHDGAREYLAEVFGRFREMGIDFVKLDFLYAGALEGPRALHGAGGVDAYRAGLRAVREAIGPDAYLLGCGAPMLPSVGLVDAMRVGPDIAHAVEPADGDMSQPSQRAATANVRARAWQQGRFWTNDPDCLLTAPAMAERARWAATVERFGGLRGSSDRLRGLDEWGLATTRRLVRPVAPVPFA
jgi:alpha-galactosidase